MDGFSFAMGALVGVAALPFFWFIVAAVTVGLWALVVNERGGWSTIFTIALGVLLVAKFPTLTDYFTWGTLLLTVPVYAVVGILWSRYKWSRFLSKVFDKIVARRDSFLSTYNLPKDYFTNFDEQLAAEPEIQPIHDNATKQERKNHEEAVKKSRAYILKQYVKHMGYYVNNQYADINTYAELTKQLIPLASNNKGSIVMWIAYWPISAVWYVFGDLLADLAHGLYKMVGGNFQKMADSKFNQL